VWSVSGILPVRKQGIQKIIKWSAKTHSNFQVISKERLVALPEFFEIISFKRTSNRDKKYAGRQVGILQIKDLMFTRERSLLA
jgi:hypothetical protein